MSSGSHQQLERLLVPVPPRRFFAEHWDRRPLVVPGPRDKFAGIYNVDGWQELPGVHDVKAAIRQQGGWQTEIAIDPRQCDALYRAGLTICADVSNDPTLAPFLREFRAGFPLPGGPAVAKLYASNDGQGFAPHADKFHVFVLQLSGSKRWRFSRTPLVASPGQGMRRAPNGGLVWDDGQPVLDDDGAPVTPPPEDDLETVLLEEGHCLYLPPGVWHCPQAVGHSIAISLSPPRTTPVEFFARLLDMLARRTAWRRDLLGDPDETCPPGHLPPSVAQMLDARLADLRGLLVEMDPRTVHRFWRLNVAAGQAVSPPEDPPVAVELTRAHRLLCRAGAPVPFLVAPAGQGGGDAIFCYLGQHEWTFPIQARRFLTALGHHQGQEISVAVAQAWDPDLPFDDLRTLLGDLVEAGVLQVRADP